MPSDEAITQRLSELIEKGNGVLASARDSERSGDVEDSGLRAEWVSQASVFLTDVLGPDHLYTQGFRDSQGGGWSFEVDQGLGILRAVAEDHAAGWLREIRRLIAGEVFSDFLSMAKHLLAEGYKDAATMLIGAVLEDGLRRVLLSTEATPSADDNLQSMATKLLQKQLITTLERKQLSTWTELRDHAAHGEFDLYAEDDARAFLRDVTAFLAKHLR